MGYSISSEEYNSYKVKKHKNEMVKKFFLLHLGLILLSIGVYFFKIPNGFSTGGVSGIGTILGNVTNITAAAWITIVNVALLIVGFLFLGKETGILTVYCSLMFSAITWILEIFIPMKAQISNEAFLELVYAMLLTSIGSAMILYCNASSGGTDIIALIIKKYTKMDAGKALLISDFCIAASTFFVFSIKAGLFSILGLFAKAFLVDSVIDSFCSCKYFIAITDKGDKVTEYIIKNMHHGVTSSVATGEYTGENKVMIHTVCKRLEAIKLRSEIKKIDPHAFIIITTTSEIIGRGFREV